MHFCVQLLAYIYHVMLGLPRSYAVQFDAAEFNVALTVGTPSLFGCSW